MKVNGTRMDLNRSAILAQLGAHGPTSRAGLARTLDLSPTLITQVSKRLLSDGLVVELETTPSTGGRPARLIALAMDVGAAIGVRIAWKTITMAEVGIDGTVVRTATVPFHAGSPNATADLVQIIREFIGQSTANRLLGVGVGLPGSANTQADGVVQSSQLGWPTIPLGDILRRELKLPVLIENNVAALTVAEQLFGAVRGHRFALVITLGTFIGSGILSDGVIMRGSTGSAGALGHIPAVGAPTDPEPRQCQCGAVGCLETIIAQANIIRTAIGRGILPMYTGINEDVSMSALKALADDGDPAAITLFLEVGAHLGRAVAGATNLLDPEIVIILGDGMVAWHLWAPGFEPAFRAALADRNRGIQVLVETLPAVMWAQGAAALVLATPFDATGIAGDQGRAVRQLLENPTG